MNTLPLPLTRDLVLIGGGHAHALVLRRWGMRPVPGARLTLINPGPTAPYTGMLPGFVAGHYGRDELEIDLVRLARFAGARLVLGEAEGIDRENRRIHVSGRPDIAFDIASIDIGITSDMPDMPGFLDHGVPAKPLGTFATKWAAYRDGSGDAAIAVIGGGVAGAELAMAMHHHLTSHGRKAQITVIDAGQALPGLGPAARIALIERLRAMGIRLIEGAEVTRVDAHEIILRDGRRFAATFTVGAAGARPYRWLATTGLDLTDGYLDVDDQLRTSDPAIYAAGDCVNLVHAPRPKAGVFAVRAAPVLTHNLRADLVGTARKRFQPQTDYLKLISLGDRDALGEKWGQVARGGWVWRLKNRIDRRFMDGLANLPAMPAPRLPRDMAGGAHAFSDSSQSLCGGCGAKVGAPVLSSMLADLPPSKRKDVLSAPGDDAAVLAMGKTRQVLTTDHLRAFTGDPYLFARIATVHALGDIWAMGAAPQAALVNVILPRMTPAMQKSTLAEIMAGAAKACAEAGAEIVGGHTSIGAELGIGLTLTGLLAGDAITLAGAKPGDSLLLTRPLGSGTLMAADMALRANGADVAAALATMAQGQADAARALARAHAMTDVTGFGLAGHLMAICDASGVGATVSLSSIPTYAGAEALAAGGIRSTLYPENRKTADRMTFSDPGTARTALLFDPQTSGGLMAALPADAAKRALTAIRKAGHQAAIIGSITDTPPQITVT
ncbi:MAG: selenide, water dikinase SelD [Rhodobacteraceae bacterium]|nr:selenide, water dikinase SelD [Paracoccaceae bacterium]